MSAIPTAFDPMGTLGKTDRLPYLPADFPYRDAVLDGVWDGVQASSGSTGEFVQDTYRYSVEDPTGFREKIASIIAVARTNSFFSALYDLSGSPVGVYSGVGFFNKQNQHFYRTSAILKNICYDVSSPIVRQVQNGEVYSEEVYYFAGSRVLPDRAGKIMTTAPTFASLYLNRTLTDSEIVEIVDFIESKK